jgi:Domain of unknown function (DUF4190)
MSAATGFRKQRATRGLDGMNTPSHTSTSTSNNGLAIGAFIMGLLGVALPAIICGHISRKQIDRSGGLQTNRWMATTAIVCGWAWIALYVLIIIIAAVAAGGSASSY